MDKHVQRQVINMYALGYFRITNEHLLLSSRASEAGSAHANTITNHRYLLSK